METPHQKRVTVLFRAQRYALCNRLLIQPGCVRFVFSLIEPATSRQIEIRGSLPPSVRKNLFVLLIGSGGSRR